MCVCVRVYILCISRGTKNCHTITNRDEPHTSALALQICCICMLVHLCKFISWALAAILCRIQARLEGRGEKYVKSEKTMRYSWEGIT